MELMYWLSYQRGRQGWVEPEKKGGRVLASDSTLSCFPGTAFFLFVFSFLHFECNMCRYGFLWGFLLLLLVIYPAWHHVSFLDPWFLCLTLILAISQPLGLQIFLLPCFLIKICYRFYTVLKFLEVLSVFPHSFLSLLFQFQKFYYYFFGGKGRAVLNLPNSISKLFFIIFTVFSISIISF